MSIDMSQFYQVFFEESQEHLASMETLLLELDIRNPDAEQLNAIFRAAHSIKGSPAPSALPILPKSPTFSKTCSIAYARENWPCAPK